MEVERKWVITAVIIMGVLMVSGEEKFRELTDSEKYVIENKETERAFTGEYDKHFEEGVYNCKKCGAKLFESNNKFEFGCGWPSFDEVIPGAIKEIRDADGRRTEIVCGNCGGHLGHVFRGEGLTKKNTRHCVNSISLNFLAKEITGIMPLREEVIAKKAYFAGGCFWGMQYHFNKQNGVISTSVGYTGGQKIDPNYQDVSGGMSGHAEAIEVRYDPAKVSFEVLAKLFFEIHDPTQINRQGPDMGHQYRSALYYVNEAQKDVAEKLVNILKDKGYDIVTEILSFSRFYNAEDYHQEYYKKRGSLPYCHIFTKRFD